MNNTREGLFVSGNVLYLLNVLLLLLAAGLNQGRAQTGRGSVTGALRDTAGGVLQGARVELEPGGFLVVSNNQGNYTINDVAPGIIR